MRTIGGGEDGIGFVIGIGPWRSMFICLLFLSSFFIVFFRSLLSKAKSICDVFMSRQNIAI